MLIATTRGRGRIGDLIVSATDKERDPPVSVRKRTWPAIGRLTVPSYLTQVNARPSHADGNDRA
jgi:hypothetical protein